MTVIATSMLAPNRILLLLGVAILASCDPAKEKVETKPTLFQTVESGESGVRFRNTLTESDSFNIIKYLYFYNGGGVAIGDINNDGLADLYFSSNQEPNRLYLNKGDFKFEDITDRSGVAGVGNWKTGVSLADVNGDGYLDIYACGVGSYKNFSGRNQLLINNKDLTFTDQTEAFGLSFQGLSTQSVFFDYDNDGDLDMYLLNHSVHSVRSYGNAILRHQTDPVAGDRLYRNELFPEGESHFEDVTAAAGIFSSQIGYGLGVNVSDLNNDGYMDIYVSNDFHENDYLYINQKNGTFAQQIETAMPHVSRFSMGNDIGDLNNDGWLDVMTLDMLPGDEAIIKASGGDDPYEIYQFKLRFGYHYQYARNALQINRGLDANGNLLFSDIAPYAGVEATDWSWSPLLADFDNDGWKDLFVANGIVRRPNDLDYINYISSDSAQRFFSDQQMIDRMPAGSVANYLFRNEGGLKFRDMSEEFLPGAAGLSNGAAYGDLDNDGDLDLVVNNINEEASLFRNTSSAERKFLRIKLLGAKGNSFGVGARIHVYTPSGVQTQQAVAVHGWQSSSEPVVHFGVADHTTIDSVRVIWPGGKSELAVNVVPNQVLTFQQSNAEEWSASTHREKSLFRNSSLMSFVHRENAFESFTQERLMPHMLSAMGPKLAIGDVNKDGLEDVFVGGAKGQTGEIHLQQKNGLFIKSRQAHLERDSVSEDAGATFFDADGDGDADLVVTSGGHEEEGDVARLQTRLYLNNGKGQMVKKVNGFPSVYLNASCVRSADVDGDGDLDLFIGGRVVAGKYGIDPISYLMINNGNGDFTIANDRLPAKLGMVSDAAWQDVNGDKKPDLILVGEWMPVAVLVQDETGKWTDQTRTYGLEETKGWWNSLTSADLDGDGDLDLLAGNLGENSRLRATADTPVELWVGDIDSNGSLDPILTYFNNGRSYPFASRDQLVKQVPALKKKFLKYTDFTDVRIDDLLTPAQKSTFVEKQAQLFSSVWLESTEEGFKVHRLPDEAQLFPIMSMKALDVNSDGIKDIVAAGNFYDVLPDFGRYDAGYGLVMLGDGKGNFQPQTIQQSGFLVRGEGRDIAVVKNSRGEQVVIVSRNNDTLLTFTN